MSISLENHSAVELIEKLRKGELTSRELLEYYLQRLDESNHQFNAVVATNIEQARRQADAADEAIKKGASLGLLHGLPMTVKDTFEVPGMPCTAGMTQLRHHYPQHAAFAVQRLLDEGAIIFGKTNVPYMASDIQSYNEVYGTTRNPWNTQLTPGGSSGGSAAALAAGLTPLELGSDIAGSIRIPSHYCGSYGHKTSYGLIPLRGHIPGMPGSISEPDMAVAGPMARTPEDLRLLLEILTRQTQTITNGWQLQLRSDQRKPLSNFRVLFWMDDADCPVDAEMCRIYENLRLRLEAAGVTVTIGQPQNLGLETFYRLYVQQLSGQMMAYAPRIQRWLMRLAASMVKGLGRIAELPRQADLFYRGAGISHADWLGVVEESGQLRERFLTTFSDYDVILAPPTFTTAPAHDHSRFMAFRKLKVDGRMRHYIDLFMWSAPATLLGLPATSAPIGLTRHGLPVNVQIIGAPYADFTTIRFAELLRELDNETSQGLFSCSAEQTA
ncbi:MAG: amidase [Hahellaceae bacterium]|nr:amidase [Hahellaceae bacterium]MCP5169142.1 amidase [Hahellaceae bacterium]